MSLNLVRTGNFNEAKQLSRELVRRAHQALGARHELTIITSLRLAEALRLDPAASRDDMLEAEALAVDGAHMTRQVFGAHHPRTIELARALAIVRQMLARHQS